MPMDREPSPTPTAFSAISYLGRLVIEDSELDDQSALEDIPTHPMLSYPAKEIDEKSVPTLDFPSAVPWAIATPKDLTGKVVLDSVYPSVGGSYADIYLGTLLLQSRGPKTKVAVKVMRAHTFTDANQWKINKRLKKEIRLWSCLQHPNIVPLLGTTTTFGSHISMVCPWMKEGNLNDYLSVRISELNLRRRLEILTDVAEGLSYLHALSIIHGDLTTGNIMMDDGKARLTDFGLSNVVAEFRTHSFISSNVASAVRWAAPELFDFSKDVKLVPEVTRRCDIYSFGSVALQVISGRIPYDDILGNVHVLLKLLSGTYPSRPSEPLLSNIFWDFIVLCWELRPEIDTVRNLLLGLRQSCNEEALAANVVGATVERPDRGLPKANEEQVIPVLNPPAAPWASTKPDDLTGLIARDHKWIVAGGGYANIYRGTLSKDGLTTEVAIKMLLHYKFSAEQIDKRLKREISLWSCLRHPNIVPLLGTTTSFGPYPTMVSPWKKHGNLNNYLYIRKPELILGLRLKILTDVIDGLSYLHGQSIMHGDLTTANILMEDDKAYLTDFGLSNVAAELQNESFVSTTVAGAVRWAAPELYPLSENDVVPVLTKHCDIYSFGSVALQVISGHMPYGKLSNEGVMMALIKGNSPPRPSEPLLSNEFWNFIVPCWSRDPSQRPEIDQVKERLQELLCSCTDEALGANIVDADKPPAEPLEDAE